jgi:hypothetical protein
LLQQTGFSDSLIFKLPDNVSLVKGDYSIIVSNLISDYNYTAKANTVVSYSIGSSEGSVAETLFTDGLDAGGLIPQGWKVTWGTNVREQNTTGLGNGPRLLDFPNGGDFKAAFYLRDEGSTSHLTYGSYEDSRLHLKAGKQMVSFYYSWWTAGAQTSNKTIEFAVLDKSGNTVFESKNVSTTSLITSNSAVPTGSKLNEFEVTIPTDADYILEWRTVNFGWDGALVGNVKITSVTTRAAKYKSMLAAALLTANQAKSAADSSLYDGSAKTALIQAINTYSAATFTAPSAVQAAIDDLKATGDALLAHKTNVINYITSLATANNRVAAYGGTRYNQTAPYLKLVQKISLYGAVSYTNDASLKTAIDSLNQYATLTLNWITNAIPALTYRINKSIVLAEKVGVASTLIEPARNVMNDDNSIASNLNSAIKTSLEFALATGILKFGKSSENPANTDSLELTGFIRNPNFYTAQTAMGITGTTFPGWSVPTANTSTDAGPDVLATASNPIVDTDVRIYNNSMARFEQSITGLPNGLYNIYMKTRIPTNVVSVNSYIFYALITGSDSLKANFKPGAMTDRIQTGFRSVRITDGNLKIGVRVGLEQVMDPTVRWGDPTLWMVGGVLSGISEANTEVAIREIQYYTFMGQRINRPMNGLNIIKTVYENGKIDVQKVIMK